MDIQEHWRAAADCPGYEVSDEGGVRRSELFDSYGRLVYETEVLSQCLGGSVKWGHIRYWEVSIRVGKSKRKNRKVHHLVCATFHGPRPPGLEACHENGEPLDNRASNLYWGTHAQNMADMARHGRHPWSGRTECINGHDITDPDNVYGNGQGRKCKLCQRARSNARRLGIADYRELLRADAPAAS